MDDLLKQYGSQIPAWAAYLIAGSAVASKAWSFIQGNMQGVKRDSTTDSANATLVKHHQTEIQRLTDEKSEVQQRLGKALDDKSDEIETLRAKLAEINEALAATRLSLETLCDVFDSLIAHPVVQAEQLIPLYVQRLVAKIRAETAPTERAPSSPPRPESRPAEAAPPIKPATNPLTEV